MRVFGIWDRPYICSGTEKSKLHITTNCFLLSLKSGTLNYENSQSYMAHSIRFQNFLYRHLKLKLENSLCYCDTSYEMTDQFLLFQV